MLVSSNHLVSCKDKKLSISLLFNAKSKDGVNFAFVAEIEMNMNDGFVAGAKEAKKINEIVNNYFVRAMVPIVDYQSDMFTMAQAKEVFGRNRDDLMLSQRDAIELKKLQKYATKCMMNGMINLDVAGVVKYKESGIRIKSTPLLP